ncbi:MAG: integrase domain-containing protein [Alphaproteobacteria bacterium]|nr:integrase domain-containing protein [Alphaproteobacteria bacterium]
MDALAYDLKELARVNRDGSFATQSNRARMLQMIARELKEGGYKLPAATSIKPKHIEFLIKTWQSAEINARTIKNRLGALRWWASKVRKTSIMERTNEAYGIATPQNERTARAQKLDRDKLATIECPYIRAALELQAAFGLRREEAIKFQPRLADQGDFIALKASWTKGGKYREVPITHPRQREILNQVAALASDGSLIPRELNYIKHLKAYEYQTLKAGLGNTHGLRHQWAQWRYRQLAGCDCPMASSKPTSELTGKELWHDREARRQLSHELGHGRLDVTKVYLG